MVARSEARLTRLWSGGDGSAREGCFDLQAQVLALAKKMVSAY